jgi:DNA-binding transcriptional LysR family regulator
MTDLSDDGDETPRKSGPSDDQRFVRRVDWNLFRQFYDIIQAGSVSAAARRLSLHQPSLSAALKRLEEHLGVTLCRRTSQGVDLTPAGKAVMRLASDMVEAVRMAPHLVSQAEGQIEGRLSIRMISSIVSKEFDETVSALTRRHPNIEIIIKVSSWREVIDALSSGECDVALTYDRGPRPHLQYQSLFRETQQLYCGRTHPLYGLRISKPAALARERFILTEGDEPEDLERFRRRYGLGQNPAGRAEDLHEVMRLIKLGVGIGFLPTIVARSADDGSLWPLLAEPLLPEYFIYLVFPPALRLTTPAQLLVDEMRRLLTARDAQP